MDVHNKDNDKIDMELVLSLLTGLSKSENRPNQYQNKKGQRANQRLS